MAGRAVIWLRLPESWPAPVAAVVALLLLTALDLAGSTAAKEAVAQRSWVWASAGAGVFVLMFWVFASTLRIADLSAVSVGWCVLVTVGVLALDHFRYGVHLTLGKGVAAAVAVVAMTYMIAGPAAQRAAHVGERAWVRAKVAQILGTGSPAQPRHLLGADVPALPGQWRLPVEGESPRTEPHLRSRPVAARAVAQAPVASAHLPARTAGPPPRRRVTVEIGPADRQRTVRVSR